MTEHRWVWLTQERPGEVTLGCNCTYVVKHLQLNLGRFLDFPECPQKDNA